METRRQLLNLTTATKENALTEAEREEFLHRRLVGVALHLTVVTSTSAQ